ncbi:MAG: CDP-alcohol phosphatidyltransferase family protein [Angustibacter sp.]
MARRASLAAPGPPGGSPEVGQWTVLTPANALTGVRLALVPLFGFLLMHDGGSQFGWRVAAFATFAVAAVTDRFDGELARRRGQVTAVGTLADPIADKALVGTALVGLSLLGELAWWVTVVVLIREIGITILRLAVIRRGVLAASRGGKLKTLLQSVAIGLLVLPLQGLANTAALVVMGLAVLLALSTGVDYVVRVVRQRPTPDVPER